MKALKKSCLSVRDVVPWSLIYAAQNERHRRELVQKERKFALDALTYVLKEDDYKQNFHDVGHTARNMWGIVVELDTSSDCEFLVRKVIDYIREGVLDRGDVVDKALSLYAADTLCPRSERSWLLEPCRRCDEVLSHIKASRALWMQDIYGSRYVKSGQSRVVSGIKIFDETSAEKISSLVATMMSSTHDHGEECFFHRHIWQIKEYLRLDVLLERAECLLFTRYDECITDEDEEEVNHDDSDESD